MISNIYVGINETTSGIGQQGTSEAIQSKSDKVLRHEQISSKIHMAIMEMPKRNQESRGSATSNKMPTKYSNLIPSMSSRIDLAISALRRELQATV